jgi:hypothetical protein
MALLLLGRPFRGWSSLPPPRRIEQAVGKDLMHALTLLGPQLGFQLGERAHGFFLLLRPQVAELVDQRPEALRIDRRAFVFGDDLLAQLLRLALPFAADLRISLQHALQRLALAVVEIDFVGHHVDRARPRPGRRRRAVLERQGGDPAPEDEAGDEKRVQQQ